MTLFKNRPYKHFPSQILKHFTVQKFKSHGEYTRILSGVIKMNKNGEIKDLKKIKVKMRRIAAAHIHTL